MRLQNLGTTDESVELKNFVDWIASIGDGTIGDENNGETKIDIPNDKLLNYLDDLVAYIVQSTFHSFSDSAIDASYLQGRSIILPNHDVVDSVNEYMLSINSVEASTYLSSDSTCISDSNVDILQDVHTLEFLNGIKCYGVPNHVLNLKVGTLVMLLRNIDHTRGLCDGTRLVITRLGKHVLKPNVLAGNNTCDKVLIPRMSLTPSDRRLPFKFNGRQFPLIVSYGMTINKRQFPMLAFS